MEPKEEKEIKKNKSTEKRSAIVLTAFIVFICGVFYIYQLLFSDNILVDKPSKSLYIPRNATFQQVVDSLEKGQFLHDRLSFMFLSKLSGYREAIIPGKYDFETNSSNFNLLKRLIKGRQSPSKLTFNNTRLKQDLASKLSKKLALDSVSIITALNDRVVCQKYGFTDTTILSMFIPNTYEVYWTISIEDFLDKMSNEYQKFWAENNRAKKASEIKLTQNQVSSLAAIVEAETQKDSERPKVAGVYMNRYLANQRLQADPTIIFAVGDFYIKRVLEGHRNTISPYNTYRNKGLPPGPINVPSISSIDAVLNYEKHNYYFFCAQPNLSGYHDFSTDFEGHKKVANKYWDALNKIGIH